MTHQHGAHGSHSRSPSGPTRRSELELREEGTAIQYVRSSETFIDVSEFDPWAYLVWGLPCPLGLPCTDPPPRSDSRARLEETMDQVRNYAVHDRVSHMLDRVVSMEETQAPAPPDVHTPDGPPRPVSSSELGSCASDHQSHPGSISPGYVSRDPAEPTDSAASPRPSTSAAAYCASPDHPASPVSEPDAVPQGGSLECEYCGKSFIAPSKLRRHRKVHTGERPYPCSMCSKSFKENYQLGQHVSAVHLGHKPHSCDSCPREFGDLSTLKKHQKSHDPQPSSTTRLPHVCDQCDKRFCYLSELHSHLISHDGSKPHLCHLCGRAYATAYNLQRHMLAQHSPTS